jgi:hypothetical protein
MARSLKMKQVESRTASGIQHDPWSFLKVRCEDGIGDLPHGDKPPVAFLDIEEELVVDSAHVYELNFIQSVSALRAIFSVRRL